MCPEFGKRRGPSLRYKLHLRRKLLFCEDSGGVDQEFRPDPSADARLSADLGGEWAQPACKGRRLPVVSFRRHARTISRNGRIEYRFADEIHEVQGGIDDEFGRIVGD